jgi:ABC-2 type transport system permease protein
MLLFPYLLSTIFLGIGLSTLFRHRESAMVFMVFLSPIALFLSGLSWPVSAMPVWLVNLSKVIPSTTVVPAYLRLRTMGVSISEIKTELITLYYQAGIYAVLTISYFFVRVSKDRRKQEVQVK